MTTTALCSPVSACVLVGLHTRLSVAERVANLLPWFARCADDSGLHTVRRAASPNNTDTSGSTFPTISFAYVRSSSAQLTLLSSQPHAVASRAGGALLAGYKAVCCAQMVLACARRSSAVVARHGIGELEAILHRRMTQWSLFNGLFQALNDTSVLGDTVWVTVDTPQGAVDQMHSQSLLLNRYGVRWRGDCQVCRTHCTSRGRCRLLL